MKEKILFYIIVGLVFLFLIQECWDPHVDGIHSTKSPYQTTTIETIPGDPLPVKQYVPDFVKVPVPVYRDTGSTKILYVDTTIIDTMAILKDYFTRNGYDITLKDDSSAMARIKAHTWKNQLFIDEFIFQNRRSTQVQKNTYRPQRNGYYLGFGTGYDFTALDPSVKLLITIPRKKIAFGGSKSIFSKNFELSFYFQFI